MLIIFRRAVLPLLLCLGGIAAMVYGVRFHTVAVLEDREKEDSQTIMVPAPAGFPGMDPMSGPDDMGGPPQMVEQKVTVMKKWEETLHLAEPALIYDATIGGIVLNEKLVLKRTYSGTPPQLCPT